MVSLGIKKEVTMDKQRWEEICLEEGYSQHTIDSLWKDKPSFVNMEKMTEEALRSSCKIMKEQHPGWAVRENDEGWEEED